MLGRDGATRGGASCPRLRRRRCAFEIDRRRSRGRRGFPQQTKSNTDLLLGDPHLKNPHELVKVENRLAALTLRAQPKASKRLLEQPQATK